MEKPTPPGEFDCCESGCEPCIWDHYYAELAQWKAQQASAQEAAKGPTTAHQSG